MDKDNVKVTGVMFYYYFVCYRKLWYFFHDIQMENQNDNVIIGKMIDQNAYLREKKHIMIDGVINIDFIEGYKVIHEVKKSKSIEEAGIWQLKYYLWYLKSKGIIGITGMIDYPVLKRREKIKLTNEDEIEIERILQDIKSICQSDRVPDKIKSKVCKNCSYYELCYV
ncbi:MAG: CRISPR-associated protein Cas4 [Firmicutes bacterium HGW-Firmicutes-7]|nr:MAG: CRISPR-associated protein Cas4 [Firmicutes bacterium HGW-Firmicutes-7]